MVLDEINKQIPLILYTVCTLFIITHSSAAFSNVQISNHNVGMESY